MTLDLDLWEREAKDYKVTMENGHVYILDAIPKELHRRILALIEEVRRLQKENEGIVDDALRCTQFCDAYKERLASAEEALKFYTTHNNLFTKSIVRELKGSVEIKYFEAVSES